MWAAFGAPDTVRNEILNVADDGPAAKAEIVAWVAEELGIARPRFNPEVVSARRALTPDRLISNAKAKAMLGWSPRFPTYREGYTALLRA